MGALGTTRRADTLETKPFGRDLQSNRRVFRCCLQQIDKREHAFTEETAVAASLVENSCGINGVGSIAELYASQERRLECCDVRRCAAGSVQVQRVDDDAGGCCARAANNTHRLRQ
jgi:hypothetical protein